LTRIKGYTGVTVHLVSEGVDSGPILLQTNVPIFEDDSLESLTERIHQYECAVYPVAIREYLKVLK